MLKLIKVSLMVFSFAFCACGIKPVVKSPCAGLYCIGVEVPEIPGSELICYDTMADANLGAEMWESKGYKVNKDQE
jgi:hypothetical protein